MMTAHIVLISPHEIRHALAPDAHYTIVDARPYEEYVAGHIPGALWMGWEAWCQAVPAHAGPIVTRPGYWGVLKEHTDVLLQESLRQSGLSDARPILVYADGVRSKGREGRIAWMFLYLGISPVALLDGGWHGWLAAGGPCETDIPIPTSSRWQPRVQSARRISLPHLKRLIESKVAPALVDVRSQAEYAGQQYAYQPRMGRLPGAVHVPFTMLFDEVGRFVTKSVYLRQLPPSVRDAHWCVAYCEVGVRSALFALLHEVYTGRVVANFDGSFMQWALEPSLPMECDAR